MHCGYGICVSLETEFNFLTSKAWDLNGFRAFFVLFYSEKADKRMRIYPEFLASRIVNVSIFEFALAS